VRYHLIGFVELPPEAIKDAEGVGQFAQVFFVSDCQDLSGDDDPFTMLSSPRTTDRTPPYLLILLSSLLFHTNQ